MPTPASQLSVSSAFNTAVNSSAGQAQSSLDMPVTALAGVGPKVAEQLAQLGIVRIFDLLLHLPRDYEDRSRVVSIAEVGHGQAALITGRIVHVDNQRSGMSVVIDDGTGTIGLRFFKVYPGLLQTMGLGTQLQLFGEVKVSRYGKQIHHPEYQVITDSAAIINTGLQPIYPTVKGLHQNKLRTLIKLALQTVRSQGLPMTLFNSDDFTTVADLPLVPFNVQAMPATNTMAELEDIFSTLVQRLQSGNVLEYQGFFTNTNADRVRKMTVTMSIPQQVELLRVVAPDFPYGSADGTTFARMPLRGQVDGQNQEIPLKYYQAVRWDLEGIGLNDTVVVKYRAKVK